MRFRLNVRKTKCVDCDVIVLVENNENATIHLLCPVCAGDLVDMEDEITVIQEEAKEKFSAGDIVRFKHDLEIFGLYEVTGEDADGNLTVTNNECNSERFANKEDLIFVCSWDERYDG